MASIFQPLLAEGLTTLALRHDWRSGRTWALAGRSWGPDRDFARYGDRFDHETLDPTCLLLDQVATRALYERHGATSALERLAELVARGRHQGVDLWLHAGRNIRVLSNMHASVLGLDNRRHAIRAGGIRRHEPSEPEEAVFVDGLNLARAMTFKNAAAGIPYGGSKICVIANPIALDDWEALGFLAWCIDRARCFTGPDMGLLPGHADAIRARFSRNIVGGAAGVLGPTGAPTAEGLCLAIEVAMAHHLGRGLEGASVALQGLGAVGASLAERLLRAGVGRLLVADPDPARLQAVGQADDRVEAVDPGEVLFAQVDVVSPNAVGGVLGLEAIERLRCRIVMGAANNQLQAVSQAEELALADRLSRRGVLYQIDWMHNGAGVIAGCEAWERQEAAELGRVVDRLRRICGDGVRANLSAARQAGLTPTAWAYRSIEAQIYR